MRRSTTLRMSGALLASCAVLLAACAPAPNAPAGEEIVVADQIERSTAVQITNFTVPGPALGAPALEGVNRVGSAQVPVRMYEPAGAAWATLVWAHGGSFLRGTLDWPEADWVAQSFAERGVRVVSVDYVLASDSVKAPALSNDVSAVVSWAASAHEGPLVVGGASAGAQLAVLATLEHASAIDALILQYPTLHRVQRESPSVAAAAEALPEERRFRADRIADMYDYYLGSSSVELPANFIVAGELSSDQLMALPPTVIVNADLDELRASGEEFADQLSAAGVQVTITLQPGTVHGYLNRPHESTKSEADANETIDTFVGALQKVAQISRPTS